MKTLQEQIQLLVQQLQGLGVEPRLLQQVSIHLPPNYQSPDHWCELAVALRRARNYGAAELVYKTALATHGCSARLWNNYGILLRDWEKLDEALGAFDRAIGIDSRYAKAIGNKANIFERLHEYGKARSYYQAALDIDPTDVAATNNMAVCFLGEGQADQAEAWFEKTLQLNRDWVDALFNLAALRLGRGDFEAARPLVERLSLLLPQDAEVEMLKSQLSDQDGESLEVGVSPAQKLQSAMSPAVKKLCKELWGNPRSVFISYAWPDSSTQQFAVRLARDLESKDYQVVLDQKQNLEVNEILTLLLHCQNVLVLNDTHYAESCLLGKVPITKTTSIYPSFAFPLVQTKSEEYLGMVFKISATVWEIAKQMKAPGITGLNDFAFQVAQPDAYKNVPGLRMFIEGWRIDEIQLIFANLKRFRSISVAYLGGENCLAGYPLLDFSKEEYYRMSFACLVKILELIKGVNVVEPIEFDYPDWTDYRWPDSSIVSAKLWKVSGEDVAVLRPSITPTGETAAIISRFKDWELLRS